MKYLKNLLLVLLLVGMAACTTKPSETDKVETQTTPAEEPALVQRKAAPSQNTANAQVNWMSIADLQTAMKKDERKVMVDLYTSWCGWCKRMDKATFQNPEIAKYLNDNFYAVKFNAEDQQTIPFKGEEHKFVPAGRKGYNELAYKFANGRMSYPTIAFLDEDLNRIDSYPGYKQPQQFDPLLKFIKEGEYKSQSFQQYAQGFQSNIKTTGKAQNKVQLKKN